MTLRFVENVEFVLHVQPMEMQRRRLVPQRVQDIDDNLITDVCCDLRDWPLPVDADRRTCKGAIWVCGNPPDFEVVCNGGSLYYSEEGNKCQQKHA